MLLPRRWALSGVVVVLSTCASPAGEFYQDFRGGGFDDTMLDRVGRGSVGQIRQEDGGLRIALPAQQSVWPQTGISPRFIIRGDFEITLSYELLALDAPTSGYGTGVMVWIQADEQQGTASLARRRRVKDGEVYATDRATLDADGRLRHQKKTFPTTARSGRLRLQRTGEILRYLAADGDSDSFRELFQVSFGKADLSAVRVVADPGGASSKLDVVLKDLRVNCDEIPGPGRQRRFWGWVLVFAAAGLLEALVVACAFLRWHHRRPASNPVETTQG